MKITSEVNSEILILHPEGRLDAISAGEFEKEVTPLVMQSGQNVLLDFSRIDYISSAGLRSILILAKELKKNEKMLVLCCLNETINEVFRISGFDTIIQVLPTLDEGISSLNKN